jgi:hypothetical protein
MATLQRLPPTNTGLAAEVATITVTPHFLNDGVDVMVKLNFHDHGEPDTGGE